MTSIVSIERATIQYGELTAVDQVSLDLTAGELVLLLGTNGAGKSSLMKGVVGLVPLAGGRITLDGVDLGSMPPSRRVRAGLGYLPEGRGVFPTLTVEENMLSGVPKRAARSAVLERSYGQFPRLGERRRQVAGSLSGGEQQMLSLSRALAGDPKLLLLDEPSLGLAPAVVGDLFESIARLRDEGMTILLVEQFAHAALRIADRAGVMVRGQLARVGAAADLLALSPEELAQQYFHGSDSADVTAVRA